MALKSNLLVEDRSPHSLLPDLEAADFLARLWRKDHTLWADSPEEIVNRLGWLDSPRVMSRAVAGLRQFAEDARQDFSHALLLGMGGSSLAPEVFARVFGPAEGWQDLHVLDSTDPGAVLRFTESLDPKETLFIVSTKSGGTVETFSLFKHFYNHVKAAVGSHSAGRHFIAITDPGSALEAQAGALKFRQVFLNDPDIGGRYSALSFFGLVPAALLGVELDALLAEARRAAHQDGMDSQNSLGLALGASIGHGVGRGRDKLTFRASPDLAPFADWVEQLIAESTGKAGTGILPVVGENIEDDERYGSDRQFIVLAYADEEGILGPAANLARRGHPVTSLILEDEFDLSALFFHWEVAAAVLGHILGVNPFDQPDVESAKVRARAVVDSYRHQGALPPAQTAELSAEAIEALLAQADEGSYIAVQAFLTPRPATTEILHALQSAIAYRTRCACTVGYGPRYLHSTGQLHKGDAGKGLFIQFVSPPEEDAPIPDEAGQSKSSLTFGLLKQAQAQGDAEALRAAGRHVVTFQLEEKDVGRLAEIADLLG
ncbi:MAG: glucose-6-phosphate isomerase [Chloroflexi bacterium]|nr:glucose-6-phosphate isomerase [Chloroflexota bacterium]